MHDADELYRLDRRPIRTSSTSVQADLDRRRAGLHRYLRGAVAIDVAQIGVVDLGWAGSIQKSLSLGLAQIGFTGTVRGLYLATNEGAEQHLTSTNRNEGFVANLGSPEGFEPVFRNLEVIEQSCLEQHRFGGRLRRRGAACCARTTTSRRSSGTPSSASRTACGPSCTSGRSTNRRRARRAATSPTSGGSRRDRSCTGSARDPTPRGDRALPGAGATTTTRARGPSSR